MRDARKDREGDNDKMLVDVSKYWLYKIKK